MTLDDLIRATAGMPNVHRHSQGWWTSFEHAGRAFAIWMDGTEPRQPGLHLRAEAGERSTEGRNWVYVPDLDLGSLPPALQTSYAISSKRNGGYVSKKPWAEIFSPLSKALRVAEDPPDSSRFHAGGPKAKISSKRPWPGGEAHCGIALCKRALEEVRQAESLGHTSTESAALATLCETSAGHCHGGGRATSASDALVPVVEFLDRTCPERTGAFLLALDQIVLTHELDTTLVDRKRPKIGARVVWRGADAKNRPDLWIAHRDDVWYLFGKLGRRWVLETGSRADILATLPVERFEKAARFVAQTDPRRGGASARTTSRCALPGPDLRSASE